LNVSTKISDGFTMKEAEERLGVKQNILIYLCEKNVVIPDVDDPPKGRGHVRRFSAYNIFEFATALEIKEYNIKVAYIAIIMRILKRFFEGHSMKQIGLDYERFKKDRTLPLLFLTIGDGKYTFFRVARPGNDDFVPGIDLTKLRKAFKKNEGDSDTKKPNLHWWQHNLLVDDSSIQKMLKNAVYIPDEDKIKDFRSKLEINLNKIAWEIKNEA